MYGYGYCKYRSDINENDSEYDNKFLWNNIKNYIVERVNINMNGKNIDI